MQIPHYSVKWIKIYAETEQFNNSNIITWTFNTNEICPSRRKSPCNDDKEENNNTELESDEESIDLPPTRVYNLIEAIACLEDVHQFLEHKGHICEATEAICLINSLTK